ncbi:uncharacterized protein LOC141601115 [Silene latifolia]|uniref:uncharacterized protein LOC141601115 n=1 Tax=Silene latifolia TaxID=37657 RepID=UPI003D77946B
MTKQEGGLGIKKAEVWNIATVGKLVDWIYTNSDRLWIRWVHDVYLKDKDWHDYVPKSDATWVWKQICEVKEKLKDGFVDGVWLFHPKGYSIRRGYEWLKPIQAPQPWQSIVWNNWNIPKHSLISWLMLQGGMNTKAKLHNFGYCSDDRCILCESMPETIDHLFSSCVYSCKVKQLLENWIGTNLLTVSHLAASVTNSVQWKAMAVILNAYHYAIWAQRNNARVNYYLLRPEGLVKQIEEAVRGRIKLKLGHELAMARIDSLNFLGI